MRRLWGPLRLVAYVDPLVSLCLHNWLHVPGHHQPLYFQVPLGPAGPFGLVFHLLRWIWNEWLEWDWLVLAAVRLVLLDSILVTTPGTSPKAGFLISQRERMRKVKTAGKRQFDLPGVLWLANYTYSIVKLMPTAADSGPGSNGEWALAGWSVVSASLLYCFRALQPLLYGLVGSSGGEDGKPSKEKDELDDLSYVLKQLGMLMGYCRRQWMHTALGLTFLVARSAGGWLKYI